MTTHASNLQLLNNTEHRLKFKTGSGINNILTPAYSIQTDGGDDRLTATTEAFSSGDFTISMWVKLPTINHRSDMLIVNSSVRNIVIRARTDGFRFFFGGTSLMYAIGGPTVTNKWYHLVWSHSGSTATAYIDGSAASHNFENNAPLTLSFDPATLIASFSGFAGGFFGDLAIWNSALSASDVSKVYEEGASSLVNKPINFWNMGNTGLGYVTDLGSGGNNLELTGGPVFSTDTPPTSNPILKDPLLGELLFDKTGDTSGVDLDGETRIDTDHTYNGSGEITVSAWIKTTKAGKFMIATDSQAGGFESRFAFGMDGSNFYVLLGASGNQQVVHKTSASSSPVNDGQWHHLVYRVDSSNEATVWLDGSIDATYQTNFAIDNSIHVTSYGAGWPDGTVPVHDTWGLEGQLKGLGVWETALTDQQINNISMSGMDSSVPYSLSPNVWVGPTGPALYACTDTSGTVSKVSGNLKKMGDVPMLQSNDAGFTPTSSFTASNLYYGMSLWFQLQNPNPSSSGNLRFVNLGSTAGVYFNTSSNASHIFLRSFGYFDSNTADQWNHPDKLQPYSVSPKIPIEAGKLYNFTYLKTPSPISGQVRSEIWLNGEIIGYNNITSYYPWTPHFVSINPEQDNLSDLLFGDLAFWDQDASSITDRMYDPKGGHKGHQGDYMDLSIQPDHYYKLGSSLNDVGTDGTKGLTKTSGGNYEYKNIFGIENS